MLPLSIRRSGSMLQVFFSPTPPAATTVRTDGAAITAFHLAALNRGVFLAPRGLLALSTVLDDELPARPRTGSPAAEWPTSPPTGPVRPP